MLTAVSQGIFSDLCHKQDFHMTRSSPSDVHTSTSVDTSKCWHLQVLTPSSVDTSKCFTHLPLQMSSSKCFTPQFTHLKLCSQSTHGGVDSASAERQLRSCLLELDVRASGGARGRHTRRRWQRFLRTRQRSIFGVREAYLGSEKHIWSQKSICEVRKAYVESEKHI